MSNTVAADCKCDLADALGVCTRLFDELNAISLRYLHWKSNCRLCDGLRGRTDLDLWVAPSDREVFERVVGELGFFHVAQKGQPRQAEVQYYVGCDPLSGQLVHLDVTGALQSGGHLVKAFRLPLESTLWNEREVLCGVQVPGRVAEFGMFLLRKALECSNILEHLLLVRHRVQVLEELRWLHDFNEEARAAIGLLNDARPELSRADLEQFYAALVGGSVLRQAIYGRRVARQIASLRLYGAIELCWWYLRRVSFKTQGRYLFGSQRWSLARRPPVIAFIGPKAVGKSTLVRSTASWLRKYFKVKIIHSGRPPLTLLTAPMRLMQGVLARLLLPKGRQSSLTTLPKEQVYGGERRVGWAFCVHAVLLAYEKRRLWRRVGRWRKRGYIVVSDRCPLGRIDGQRLEPEWLVSQGRRFLAFLARLECALLAEIDQPLLLVQLKADEDTVLRRNRERLEEKGRSDPDGAIRMRFREKPPRLDWRVVRTVDLNTTGPPQEVERKLRAALWDSLASLLHQPD